MNTKLAINGAHLTFGSCAVVVPVLQSMFSMSDDIFPLIMSFCCILSPSGWFTAEKSSAALELSRLVNYFLGYRTLSMHCATIVLISCPSFELFHTHFSMLHGFAVDRLKRACKFSAAQDKRKSTINSLELAFVRFHSFYVNHSRRHLLTIAHFPFQRPFRWLHNAVFIANSYIMLWKENTSVFSGLALVVAYEMSRM